MVCGTQGTLLAPPLLLAPVTTTAAQGACTPQLHPPVGDLLAVTLSPQLKVRWLNDIPYFHFGSRQYICHQGPDINIYQKEKYKKDRDQKAYSDHSFKKRLCLNQVTKKLDCPASLDVIRTYQMPDFKIHGPVSKKRKQLVSYTIKGKLTKGEEVPGEEVYLFNLPGLETHKNHYMNDAAAVTEPIDNRVRKKITEYVRQGKRSPAVIIELLEQYVEKELFMTDRTRRRFYPDKGIIRQIISEVKVMSRSSKMDMEDTDKMLEQWDTSDCALFFRPCAVSNDTVSDVNIEDIDDEENDNTVRWNKTPEVNNRMLFVYQSKDMKRLYSRYGSNTILLDATYKTCKYAIPLYFVVVRTNVCYQVVGVFITQYETKEALTEALGIIKSWNEDVTPRYAMVDFAAEEISALEEVFEDIQVFICTFHREQAWTRWLSKRENADIPKQVALNHLRKIANSGPEELQGAVEELKSWKVYSTSTLKNYFEQTWQGEIKRWAQAWKPADLHFNTNNGVERLNEEIKYGYLREFKNCLLSELIKLLLQDFLPTQYSNYVRKNLNMSSFHMKYNPDLPKYLHNRPTWFVKHVKNKIANIDEALVERVQVIDVNKFAVPSMSVKNVTYMVEFDDSKKICKCTCADFSHQRLICKHVLLVGKKYSAYNLENVHTTLLSNPVFQLDENIVPSENKSKYIDTFSSFFENSTSTENTADTENTVDTENTAGSENTADTENTVEENKVYSNLAPRMRNKKKLILECNSTIQGCKKCANRRTRFAGNFG